MIINATNLNMLRQGYSASFKRGFAGFGVGQDWAKVASQEPSGTTENAYAWLGHFAKLREWIGPRQTKNLQAHDYTIRNKRFESTVEVPVDAIEDDQYATFGRGFEGAGQAAATWPDELVFEAAAAGATELCYDGQGFFDTDHPVNGASVSNYDGTPGTLASLWMLLDTTKPLKPFIFQLRKTPQITVRMNPEDSAVFDEDVFKFGIKARGAAGYGFWQLAYGSVGNISETNFNAYMAAMMSQESDEGYKLGVKPNLLVCGPSRRAEARALLEVERLTGGASNPNYKAVDLLVTPFLS